MATQTRAERKNAPGLSRDQLVGAYRTMLLSRRLDDREIQLKRQNKIFFQISGAGHEAVLCAAGMVLKPAHDWFYLYYRDRALCLELGVTPAEMLYEAVGAAKDPASGGRQMPSHWGNAPLNIVSASSPTGTQFLHAVGSAEASLRARLLGITEGFRDDEVVLVSAGEGTTSEGEFWESLNTAANLKLPIVYLIEDNGYAISVPVEVNTAGGSISTLVRSFPGLYVEEVDGCDLVASHAAMKRAVDYARKRKGPALVHAHVIRPYSHSLSDDEVMYRPSEEREADAMRDPVATFPRWLVAEGYATEEEILAIQAEVDAIVLAATDDALAQPQPGPETVHDFVYSPDVDPTSAAFDTEDAPSTEGTPTTMVDLLNTCMKDEMRRNPKMLIFGEDVADASREASLPRVKGKGGVFKVTWGLQKEFGGVARLQHAARRGEHRWTRDRARAARIQAGGRGPVLRLHLAGVHADSRRARDDALALQQRVRRAGRHPRDVRRLHPRRPVSLADRCVAVHTLPGTARHLSRHGARRQRPATHRDPLRRPGHRARAQAPLPPDLQQGGESRPRLHDPVRQGAHGARRNRPDDRDVRRHRAARARRGQPDARGARHRRGGHRPPVAVSRGTRSGSTRA